jgi:ATP-dependent DNA helicase RecG
LRDQNLLRMKGADSRTRYVPGEAFDAVQTTSVQNSTHQSMQDSHQPLGTIPPELQARIPPAGAKPRRDVLRTLLIDLCNWRAMSARELATILCRKDHKPLVRDYLTPMVAEGLLAYTIPEMEHHPEQRYTLPAAPENATEPTHQETP